LSVRGLNLILAAEISLIGEWCLQSVHEQAGKKIRFSMGFGKKFRFKRR